MNEKGPIILHVRIESDPPPIENAQIRWKQEIAFDIEEINKIEAHGFSRLSLLPVSLDAREWFFLGGHDKLVRILREGWLASPRLHLAVFPLEAPSTQSVFQQTNADAVDVEQYTLKRLRPMQTQKPSR